MTVGHDLVKRLRNDGMGATAIAKKVGCSRGAVYKILKGSSE